MLKFLKKEANMTHTENGAVTYRSTQSECLDLFATIGALRRERDEEITNRFLRAYAEDADLAMKTLFFARDIRGGIGERRVFRTILKWLANNEPRSLEKNIQYIAEYGRYDDLLVLMGTTCEGKVLHLIKKQLAADCAALEAGESVSLLAKWLPSVNASNEDAIRQAKQIARSLGMNDAQYRKTLSALRTKISIIENNLREKDYTFDYSKQPSKAMFKYRKAFMRNDGDRYDEFMSRVAEGTEQLHTGTLMPYEMIKPFFGRGDISDQERKAIDATWKTQEDFTGGENALVVIDGSGSMYGGADPIPATVALSLGIYYSAIVMRLNRFSMSLRPEERRRRDMPDKVLAFYIRLSSEDRDLKTNALKNESNSVFNQRRLLQDYYDTHESLHGYKVIVFCDDGVTGTHFDRPKFDELIEMARNQEIHCIMVKDLSRFGRNFLEMGNYLELILPLYGVRFISINDAFDSDDYLGVTGGLELALRNLINNMYSRDLSTKVRSAFRTRNLRGEYWGGNGFYGYQVHPHNKKRLIVDEQVRDIIVMIFESCVAGMTTSEIAQMLNDMGIPSPLEHKRRNGGFYNGVVKEETGIWLKGAVRKILTDERYTGKMITNTRETEEVGKPKMRSLPRDQWVIVPGTHEAIISEELFRTAQNALQGRIRNVNKNTAGNRANNLFVCGCCGRKLRKNPAKEPHLVCPKNDSIKGAECAGLFVNQTQIEQAVLQMLREQSRSFLEQHCLMQACIDKKLSSIQTELDANTNMTRRLQSRKAELYEQYRAGRISREKFADIQKTDSEKLARLSSRAEEIKRLLVEHYESRGNLAAGKRTADQIILLKDYDPEIIRNFVERVRVYPSGEIEIDMRTSSGFEFVTAS